jgi:hypothetical protein
MTSLFTHSLLNDTDRDVRGAYQAFSRKTVRAPLLGKDKNDRSSANTQPPRRNYAVVAKEMAKSQSLNASFRNISHYLSLIERARNTIEGVEEKLTELDVIVDEAAGLIDIDDYNSVSVGAISSASIDGIASGSGTYTGISPTSTNGNGTGSTFTIRTDGSSDYEIVNIDSDGQGYEVGDVITIAGTALGGSSDRNDAIITVTEISSLNEITTSLEPAVDDIDRVALQLQAQSVVDEISAIINGSEFWDEEIFGGLRAIGYAQVGHQPNERTLIDIQELSTRTIGSYLNAYFVNGNFNDASNLEGSYVEETSVETASSLVSLYGWDIRLEQVALGPSVTGSDAANGLITSNIGGFQTPNDPTPTPQNSDSPAQVSRGDNYLANGGSFSYSIAGDGLQLISDNLRVNGGDVIHGPYLISKNPVALNSGDTISFSWKGEVTDNAYDVYAYLLDANTGSTTELLDNYGNTTTGWSTVTHTLTADASYYFVFVSGSFDYDFTGSVTVASASGSSPVSGAITASATGTAASGISAAIASGTATGTSTFTNISQSSTSGNGSGAMFSISTNGSGAYSLGGINSAGSGYQVGDTINISGANLGGLAGVNDLTLTVTSLNPATYTVTQSSTTGLGSGAIFSISSDNSGNYTVTNITTFGENYALNDQVTIAGSNIGGADTQNDAFLTLTSVGATTFSNVTQASTSGNGSGAIFTISIDGSGNYSVSSVNSGGSGYEPDDTIALSGASLGGTSPAHDLTITVNNIVTTSGAILHIDNISISRANEPQTIIEGIDISTKNAATEAATVIADAKKQIKFRNSYLASKELALLDSLKNISTQTTSSDLLITDLSLQESVRELKKLDVMNALMGDLQKAKYLLNSGLLKLI